MYNLVSGGKSELHRAGRRVIPGGGDSKESATEIYRPSLDYINIKRNEVIFKVYV